jgi:hypothetical protein
MFHSIGCPTSANPTTRELTKTIGSDIQANLAISGKSMNSLLEQRGCGGAKAHNVYRARKVVLHDLDGTYVQDYGKIPEWCNEYERLNPGSKAVFSVFSSSSVYAGEFKDLFVSFGANVDVVKETGLPTFSIDGCHSKHLIWKGQFLLLVGRDSNNQIVILAILACDTENGENYLRFAELCEQAGIGPLLNGAAPAGEEEKQVKWHLQNGLL